MATDQEFRDLEAVVATLRRDLRESQDTINLWRQNGLGHLDSGSGKWRFGGNAMQLDNHGMQVATGAGETAAAIYIVQSLVPNPSTATEQSLLQGEVALGNHASISLRGYANSGGVLPTITAYAQTDGEAYVQISNAPLLLSSVLSPAQITTNQDNYNPTGFQTAAALRLSTDASRDITGIVNPWGGRFLLIFNVGSFNIVFKDEDAGSSAANRFALNGDVTLQPDNSAPLWYDSTSSRWRLF